MHTKGTSRISDAEMARINIEASAALAEWIDLYRPIAGDGLCWQLVDRAVSYLPMPQKTSTLAAGRFAALADRELAPRLERASEPGRVARARAAAERHPSRVFANALVNIAYLLRAGCTHLPPCQTRLRMPRP